MSDISCEYANSLLAQLDSAERRARVAESLLARVQDGGFRPPRTANQEAIELDFKIAVHLERQGWRWNSLDQCWQLPSEAS